MQVCCTALLCQSLRCGSMGLAWSTGQAQRVMQRDLLPNGEMQQCLCVCMCVPSSTQEDHLV